MCLEGRRAWIPLSSLGNESVGNASLRSEGDPSPPAFQAQVIVLLRYTALLGFGSLGIHT